jgi:outer membrane immunogenic protein
MRFASRLLAATVGMAGMVGVAHADDWNGFYLGANAGISGNDFAAKTTTVYSATGYFDPSSVPAVNAIGAQTEKPMSFLVGLGAGYNMQFGDLVVGLDADFDMNNANGSATNSGIYPCCAYGFTTATSTQTDWEATVRPRLGWLVGDVLLYGTGGLAVSDVKYSESFGDGDVSEAASSDSTRLGWAAGGGVEVPIGPGWTVKGEYLHTDLGTISLKSSLTAYPTSVFTTTDSIHTDMVKVGINWHF